MPDVQPLPSAHAPPSARPQGGARGHPPSAARRAGRRALRLAVALARDVGGRLALGYNGSEVQNGCATYRLERPLGGTFLKICTDPGRPSFVHERRWALWAGEAGLAPAIDAQLSAHANVLATALMPAGCLAAGAAAQAAVVARAMDALRQLHGTGRAPPAEPGRAEARPTRKAWANFHRLAVGRRTGVLPLQQMHARLRRIDAAFAASPVAPTLCHGDFWHANVLVAGAAPEAPLRLVDWDRAGIGDFRLDIARYLALAQVPVAQVPAALEAYGGQPPTRRALRLVRLAMAAEHLDHWGWAVHENDAPQIARWAPRVQGDAPLFALVPRLQDAWARLMQPRG